MKRNYQGAFLYLFLMFAGMGFAWFVSVRYQTHKERQQAWDTSACGVPSPTPEQKHECLVWSMENGMEQRP